MNSRPLPLLPNGILRFIRNIFPIPYNSNNIIATMNTDKKLTYDVGMQLLTCTDGCFIVCHHGNIAFHHAFVDISFRFEC